MEGAASNKFKNCSLGMKQRIGLDVDDMRIMREVLVDITKNYNCTVGTFVALRTSQMARANAVLTGKYIRVEEDESECIRVYDAANPEEVVSGILVSEIQTAKIGLEEYYIDLMKEKVGRYDAEI